MFKKKFLLLSLCFLLIFSSYEIIYATETNNNPVSTQSDVSTGDVGWIRLTCTVPTGFPGTVKVILFEVNSYKESQFFLYSDSKYSTLESLPYGTYKISTVIIIGGSEGCFETGFSDEEFIIGPDTTMPYSIPIYVGIAQEMQTSNDNKYAGMTYAEIMAELNNTSGTVTHSSTNGSTTSKEEVIFNADNEEEYFEQVEEYVKDSTQKKEEKENKRSSFIFSFGFMLFLLAGLGVVFYFFKKNSDL